MIDVIVAAWRAESTIARAVRSALDQPEVARVIVVDDASPDGTVAAAQACDRGDGRLVVLQQPANAGPAAARNRAIDAGSAPWIAILDADDWFEPGRFAGLLAYSQDADVVADNLLTVTEDEPAHPRPMLGDVDGPVSIDLVTFVTSNVAHRLRERRELGFVKPIFRRSFLDRLALRYRPELRLGEDYELYARALANGARMLLVPAQGYVYVQSAGSLAGTHRTEDLQRLRDADDGLLAIGGLDKRGRAALRAHRTSVDCKLQWRRFIDAWKAREPVTLLGTLTRSPRVSLFLAEQLGMQVLRRSLGRGPA